MPRKKSSFPSMEHEGMTDAEDTIPITISRSPLFICLSRQLPKSGPTKPELDTPVCYDFNGSPVYIGSALLKDTVQPCKIMAQMQTMVGRTMHEIPIWVQCKHEPCENRDTESRSRAMAAAAVGMRRSSSSHTTVIPPQSLARLAWCRILPAFLFLW